MPQSIKIFEHQTSSAFDQIRCKENSEFYHLKLEVENPREWI